MSVYYYPIATAIALFPFLAALFTLPYMFVQYHKYGSLLILRIAIVYSFIFYMMTSYFMTILPLPPVESVTPDSASLLLTPFHAVKLWIESCDFNIQDPSTYLNIVMNYDFLQIAFNILLLMPFGIYLRYYFKRPWYQVLVASFGYSLFFELTQISGLYGIYPYPYRWFEVDDLICNTLGGMLGFAVTPLLVHFLPTRERLDEIAYTKGHKVSYIRRLLALLTDWFIITIVSGILYNTLISDSTDYIFAMLTWFVIAIIYYILINIITRGQTLGKMLVNIKIQRHDGRNVGVIGIVVRYIFLYGIILPAPVYVGLLFPHILAPENQYVLIACSAVAAFAIMIFVSFWIHMLFSLLSHKTQLLYDKANDLVTVSTVNPTKKELE